MEKIDQRPEYCHYTVFFLKLLNWNLIVNLLQSLKSMCFLIPSLRDKLLLFKNIGVFFLKIDLSTLMKVSPRSSVMNSGNALMAS